GGVEDAFAGEAEVGQDEGGLVAMVRETGGGRGHPLGSGPAVAPPRGAGGAATGGGEGGDVVGVVAGRPFVGAKVVHPFGCPVVGVLGDDGGVAAGAGGGHPPGELVGFGAGGGEQAGVQWLGHGRKQSLGELHDAVVQVPGVGGENAELAATRLGHGGMGVSDDGDIVVGVEVAGAVGGKQPRPFTADDVQGAGVEQRAECTASDPAAAPEQISRLCAVCAARAVRAACAVVCGGSAGAGEDHPAGAGERVQAAGDLVGAEVEELAEDAACAGVVLPDMGLVILVRGRP